MYLVEQEDLALAVRVDDELGAAAAQGGVHRPEHEVAAVL